MSHDVAAERAARLRRLAGLITALLGVMVLLLVAVVVWWPGSGDEEAQGSTDVVQEYDVRQRAEVQPFEAELLSGGTFSSDRFRGTTTVVNVWGSWCGPCRQEAPDLARVAREQRGRVTFLGINVRDNPDAARAFERSFQVPYDSVTSQDSADAVLAFGGALTAAAVPTTVVVDRDGRIAARVVGVVDATTLRGLIEGVKAQASRQ